MDAVGFTTQDATIVTKIAYVADFTVSCASGASDLNLYAETANGLVSVARSVDGSKYQVCPVNLWRKRTLCNLHNVI